MEVAGFLAIGASSAVVTRLPSKLIGGNYRRGSIAGLGFCGEVLLVVVAGFCVSAGGVVLVDGAVAAEVEAAGTTAGSAAVAAGAAVAGAVAVAAGVAIVAAVGVAVAGALASVPPLMALYFATAARNGCESLGASISPVRMRRTGIMRP